MRRQAGTAARQGNRTVTDVGSASAEVHSSNIRVAVRVRPLNDRENSGNAKIVLKVPNEKLLIFDPKEDNTFFYHGVKQNNRDFTKKANRDVHFTFDRVFSDESNNQEVFEGTTKEVVDAVLEGFNCSVFAYGATGAGKTHTMLGTAENPGIIFLTVMELYRRMEDLRATKKFEVSVSYLEVYNENVRDLLAQSNFLSIRDNGNDGIAVTGLSLVKPNGADDLLSLLRYGNSNRTQHPTDHNAESSRSHAVFQVWVKQSDRVAGLSSNIKVAKMSLIDLAGSERGCATGHTGERFREGNNINRSLLALGNCINALAEGRRHVPYRDSKLTRLLQDSLGGNCKTVMIAAVSPSFSSFEDTYNTLKYADRAKNIKSNVKKNERSVTLHVTQYEKMISELRTALACSNEKVRSLEGTVQDFQQRQQQPPPETAEPEVCPKCLGVEPPPTEPSAPAVTPPLVPEELHRARNDLAALFHERREIQHKMAKLDQLESDFEQKIHSKQQVVDRVSHICLSNLRLEKLRSKLEREKNAQKPQRESLLHKKQELNKRLTLNAIQESNLSASIKQLVEGSSNPQLQQIVDDALRMKQLEVALQKCKDKNAHLNKSLQGHVEERARTESVLNQLMKTAKSLYLTLRMQSSVPEYMEEDFNNLVGLVEGGRSICWADQKEDGGKGVSEQEQKEAAEEVLGRVKETLTLSPLVESDVRLDVPPTSVLCTSRTSHSRASYVVVPAKSAAFSAPASPLPPAPPSTLDATVVLQTTNLDSTYTADVTEYILKNSSVEPAGPLPLADLPTNVPLQGSQTPNHVTCPDLANKENVTNGSKSNVGSKIPIGTPSKDSNRPQVARSGHLLSPPKLRRGHFFSKSSSDLSLTPRAGQKPVKQSNYMAATAASKMRQGLEHPFAEPAPPTLSVTNRFVANPFKKMKKSVSTMSLSSQSRR